MYQERLGSPGARRRGRPQAAGRRDHGPDAGRLRRVHEGRLPRRGRRSGISARSPADVGALGLQPRDDGADDLEAVHVQPPAAAPAARGEIARHWSSAAARTRSSRRRGEQYTKVLPNARLEVVRARATTSSSKTQEPSPSASPRAPAPAVDERRDHHVHRLLHERPYQDRQSGYFGRPGATSRTWR